MVGLIILAVFIGYIFLSIIIVFSVYKKTKKLKKMFIALAIMILIPTWDIVLGYPIYKILCWSSAGVHIYKTVDDVEGFYVGGKSQRHKPHIPYDGYKYIDYKEVNYSKPTGKYYRSYWIDNNISEECIKPRYPDSPFDEYTKIFKNGKCVIEKEIPKNEVSQWEWNYRNNTSKLIIPIVNIYENKSIIKDIKSNKIISENVNYSLGASWLISWYKDGIFSICSNNKNILKQTLKIKEEK